MRLRAKHTGCNREAHVIRTRLRIEGFVWGILLNGVGSFVCGGGLARDGGVSVTVDVDCYNAIAGKPAPTQARSYRDQRRRFSML